MTEKMQTKDKIQDANADYESGSVIAGDIDWTVGEESAIRRKFDLTITPLVTLMYMLCAIDR